MVRARCQRASNALLSLGQPLELRIKTVSTPRKIHSLERRGEEIKEEDSYEEGAKGIEEEGREARRGK